MRTDLKSRASYDLVVCEFEPGDWKKGASKDRRNRHFSKQGKVTYHCSSKRAHAELRVQRHVGKAPKTLIMSAFASPTPNNVRLRGEIYTYEEFLFSRTRRTRET